MKTRQNDDLTNTGNIFLQVTLTANYIFIYLPLMLTLTALSETKKYILGLKVDEMYILYQVTLSNY